MNRKLYTVKTFVKISSRRFFRDKAAIFWTVAFPLVFLFVFGGIFGKSNDVSFKIAMINQSNTQVAKSFDKQIKDQTKLFKIDTDIKDLQSANEKMARGELDATIILPKDFGTQKEGQKYPAGQAVIHYTQNNQAAAQTLSSVMDAELKQVNGQFVTTQMPFNVKAEQSNERSLSPFDYTFAGLLGFSILGLGIFGPMNVFPELKKQGILRRLHTTPIRVWQYFLSTMVSQAFIGLITMAVMFVVAITVFDLQVVGNILELALYIVLGITMILGVGLSIGGWAANERQAAPIGNLVTFPMMFLSGTFFPRYIMPEWLQNITAYIPLTPVIDGIRLIATEGKSLIDLGPQLLLIVGWTIVIYIIAFRTFRWE